MRSSKGLMETVVLAVVTFIIVGFVSSMAIKNVVGMGHLIRRENVQLVGHRIEATAYGLEAMNNARVEMRFKGKGYKLISNTSGDFLSYKYQDERGTYQLKDPYGTGYDVKPSSKYVKTMCLKKEGGITLKPGKCNG